MKRHRRPPPKVWAEDRYAVAVPAHIVFADQDRTDHVVWWSTITWKRNDAISVAVIGHGHLVGHPFPSQTRPDLLIQLHGWARRQAWDRLYRLGYRVVKVRLGVVA